MKYRLLGKSEIAISEIGFGTWGISGHSYGPVDRIEIARSLLLAFENGVTFFDTADLYGDGQSERILGKTFLKKRDKIIISTKVGTLPHKSFFMPQDFSVAYIEKAFAGSLKRLMTDYVDVLMLHSPNLESIDDDTIDFMKNLKKKGLVRSIGISAKSPKDAVEFIKKYKIDVIEVNFNLIDQRAIDDGLFKTSRDDNVGIVARTPLCFGYLTGQLTGKERFPGSDHRNNWPEEQRIRWANAPKLFTFLKKEGRSLTQAAIKYCISFDEVSTVIPGMLNKREVLENTIVSEMDRLSKSELRKIRVVYKNNIFYNPLAKV